VSGYVTVNFVKTTTELRRHLAESHGRNRIALVPTMGCLHEGHLSLIRKARKLADTVVVSIYVNPLQFGPDEDFASYPRNPENDAAACKAEGVDIIFHPDNLYPNGHPKVRLTVQEMSDCLCGSHRPGHFDGVATAVNILFNIIRPDIAVFGEKDWQQLAIIKRMVADLHLPIDIVSGKTVRETDGLAMSSRNRYLNEHERKLAGSIFSSLQLMAENAKKSDKNCKSLCKIAKNYLKMNKIDPEYLEIRHACTLERLERLGGPPARAFIAAKVGNARLIDNISLEDNT